MKTCFKKRIKNKMFLAGYTRRPSGLSDDEGNYEYYKGNNVICENALFRIFYEYGLYGIQNQFPSINHKLPTDDKIAQFCETIKKPLFKALTENYKKAFNKAFDDSIKCSIKK